MRLDRRQVHHALVEGRKLWVGVHDTRGDVIQTATLELAQHRQDGAVRDGGRRSAEVAGAYREKESQHLKEASDGKSEKSSRGEDGGIP